jgi:hypothetical protein
MTSLENSVGGTPEAPAEAALSKDEAQRRALVEEGLRKCHESMMEAKRELERTLIELEKEQGILERWFGYRTSV